MVKPYKFGDSVIRDNLISIETRGKCKPIVLKSLSILPLAYQPDQKNMANESAIATTTTVASG